MSARLQIPIPMKPAAPTVHPVTSAEALQFLKPSPSSIPQRKCACEDVGAIKSMIVGRGGRSPRQHSGAQRRLSGPGFNYDFSKVSVLTGSQVGESADRFGAHVSRWQKTLVLPLPKCHLDLSPTIETVGEARCDPQAGKMVWNVNYTKFPRCMADCAKTHERSHADFSANRCAKVTAAYKTAADALEKAKKSKASYDLMEAQTKADEFKRAADEYKQFHSDTCRENERRAYQAGIDYCNRDEVRKSCAKGKETEEYSRIMKEWEQFRDNPPNCPVPTPKPKQAPGPSPVPP